MKRMRNGPQHTQLCLPDDLLRMHEKEFKNQNKAAKVHYQQDADNTALVEEQKKDYLLKMYKNIEQVWSDCRPMVLKYTNKKKPKPYITIESSHGMESEPSEPIEAKQLSAAQILLKSTMEMRE